MVKKRQSKFPFCPKCKNKERRMCIGEIWGTHLVLRCSLCGFEKKDVESLSNYTKKLKQQKKEEEEEKERD